MNFLAVLLSAALLVTAGAALYANTTHQREQAAYDALVSAQDHEIAALKKLIIVQTATIAKYERAIR